jgi:AcrR family transcriptional regulator
VNRQKNPRSGKISQESYGKCGLVLADIHGKVRMDLFMARGKMVVSGLPEHPNGNSQLPNKKIEAIIQGAKQEFLAHGFAATTMDNITAAAGVSKATVYSYFPDKETLFVALVDRSIQRQGNSVEDLFDPQIFQGEPQEVVEKIANTFLDLFNKSIGQTPELLDLLRLMIAESARFPMLAQSFVRKDQQFVNIFTYYLQAHPELGLTDPGAVARVFLGTLVHFMMVEHIFQAGEILPMQRQRLVNCLVELIIDRQKISADKYAAIKDKSARRKRSSNGTFEQEYDEPKHLRSIRVTDTAWENLDAMARKNNLTRTELIEKMARGMDF